MRILYHHRTLGDGAEGIHIREMIRAFRQLGHEVKVVALVGEGPAVASQRPAQKRWSWISRRLPGGVYELAELGYNAVGGRAVARAIRGFRPDFVYDRYNSYCTAAVTAARRAGVPVLLEVNAPVAYERATFDGPALRFGRLAQRFERHICGLADHIFTVSTPLKDFLTSTRGIADDRITVLPNGANPSAFNPNLDGSAVRTRFGLAGRTVIGFVGILRPWHGIELLLSAFAQLSPGERNLHLLLVGDGPIEAELRAEVSALGLSERVTFTGRVSHSEVRQHIAAMDIAVSPRATFYASPMKILEYMAMRLPVVAPRMPNILDICEDGSDAQLFEPESSESLHWALNRLIVHRDEARRLGTAARQKIERRLNWQWNAAAVLTTAQKLKIPAPIHV